MKSLGHGCIFLIVFLFQIVSPPLNAAQILRVGTQGSQAVSFKILFPGGQGFYYVWDGQTEAKLGPSPSSRQNAPLVNVKPFRAIPWAVAEGTPPASAVLYTPNQQDRIAVFATNESWVVLMENGAVVQIPMAFGELLEVKNVRVAKVGPTVEALSYRLASGRGATLLCDISTGSIRQLSAVFMADLSKIQVGRDGRIVRRGKRKATRWNNLRDVAVASAGNSKVPVQVDQPLSKPIEGEKIFRFRSGVQVVAVNDGESGVYIKKGNKRKWVTKETVARFPLEAGTSIEWVSESDPTSAMVLVEGESQFWIVTKNGTLVPIPMDYKKVETEDVAGRTGVDLMPQFFDYKNRSFVLVTGLYKESEQIGAYDGETFLIRDDGASFRVAFSGISSEDDVEKFHVSDDGILSFDEIPREIDLESFDKEAQLQIGTPIIVEDEDGAEIDEPTKKAYQEFPDIINQIRNGSIKTFPFLPDEESVLKKIRIALSQEESGSAVLLGDAGSGKSQLIYSFLSEVAANRYPEILRTIRVFSVDRGLLEQGTMHTGVFETKVALLKYLSRFAPIYLFADEVHTLRGSGTHSRSSIDFFDMIKPELANGSIRLIGTSTDTEYYRAFAGNEALMRRVGVIKKPSTDERKTIAAMKAWLTRFNRPSVSDDVLMEIFRLSSEFSAVGAQPSKSTKLLDATFALLKIENRVGKKMSSEDVRIAAENLYSLAAEHFSESRNLDRHDGLRKALDLKVIGQTAYKDALVQSNSMRLARLQDTRRPGVRVLVAGSTAVGKTATAEAFAEAIGTTFHRIEMSKYAGGGVEFLRREIAEALRKDPFAVICLDEFEKADIKVMLGLLSLLDDGYFHVRETIDSSSDIQSSTSTRIDTTKASFIATTNAAADWLVKQTSVFSGGQPEIGFYASEDSHSVKSTAHSSTMFQAKLRSKIIEAGIPETIVGRFNIVTAALPATREEFRQIVRLHSEILLSSLSKKGASTFIISNWDPFLDAMVEQFYRPPVQNRIVHSLLDTFLRSVILDLTLKEMRSDSKGTKVYELEWTGREFHVATESKISCRDALKM